MKYPGTWMMASLPSESNTCQQIKLVAHMVDCVEVIGGSSKSSRDGVDNMEQLVSRQIMNSASLHHWILQVVK